MMFFKSSLDCLPEYIPEGAVWPYKQSDVQLRELEDGDTQTYYSQYGQCPASYSGALFKDSYWRFYDVLPTNWDELRMYADTAQKIEEYNDYSVFQVWARVRDVGIFLVDQIRGKWEAHQLVDTLLRFYDKYRPSNTQPRGVTRIMVEDKSSGIGLIQTMRSRHSLPIEGIQRNTSKSARAYGARYYFANGFVHVPRRNDWIHDYLKEFREFRDDGSHKHDDQVDPTLDAVQDLIINKNTYFTG